MYNVSEAFHTAVRNGNRQKAMMIFKDCVFTDEDISVERGISFNEYFNTSEDLGIGQANSNEIAFSLFNDDRLLNNYTFGEFLATLGVHVGTDAYTQLGNVMVTTQYATYVGYENYPFIYRNDHPISIQPSFRVGSFLAYDGKVWAFSDDGRFAVYNDVTGENITWTETVIDFMKRKSIKWYGKGLFYNKSSRILFIYKNGERERYEFCPLGWFIAERPNAPDVIQIDMNCYDRMQKFDVDMPEFSFPISIGSLFASMCNHVGVPYRSASFINSGAIVMEKPQDFEHVTMREVIKWIAEAAGSNARFDRDGYLVMDWLRNTGQSYTATGYQEFNPYWYETRSVTKVHNRNTQDGSEITFGGGDEGYLIQDNPLLRGVS